MSTVIPTAAVRAAAAARRMAAAEPNSPQWWDAVRDAAVWVAVGIECGVTVDQLAAARRAA